MIQQLGYGNPGNNGPLGISDGQGGYVYYHSLTNAMSSAKSGDIILFFRNITETNYVPPIILKNGVNINLNGFTYTILNLTPTQVFTDNNVAVTCQIINGNIKYLGVNIGTNAVFRIQNASTNITTNCYIEGNSTYIISNAGTWVGGQLNNTVANGNLFAIIGAGSYYNIYINTLSSGGIATTVYNSVIIALTAGCVGLNLSNGSGNAYNSIIIGSTAILLQNSTGANIMSCVLIATSAVGTAFQMSSSSGQVYVSNSTLISTSSPAINATKNTIFNNCTMYSSAGAASLNSYGGNKFYNCTFISVSNVGILASTTAGNLWSGTDLLYKCNITSQWNNTFGHAISISNQPSTIPFYLLACTFTVTNSKAYCLTSNVANSILYVKNTFIGAQKPVSDNIMQAQTNNRDLYGNITIG